jgi:guanosine-3',5'-bis(diphosphate) 3'-pyrophosphohydrolase
MPADVLASAASYAARAHAGQLRKDGRTPYIAHPMRVCLALLTVFNVTDRDALVAALLHDTIEDTKTDFDELEAEFGIDVANLVAAMTKDKRLTEEKRERQYIAQVINGGWRVQVLKLGDIYDNLSDVESLSVDKRQTSLARAKYYLAAMKPALADEARAAFTIVEVRLKSVLPNVEI